MLKVIKKHPTYTAFIGLIVLALLFLTTAYIHSAYGPIFKATDPDSPRFDRFAFEFEDYSTGQQFYDAVHAVFPGLPLAEVDEILVGRNEAEKTASGVENNAYVYCRKRNDWWWREVRSLTPNYPWCITLEFDESEKVSKVLHVAAN
jgi:putative hemolysin